MNELSQKLKSAMEAIRSGIPDADLIRDAEHISERYRNISDGHGQLVTTGREAIAYMMARMPATYGAACRVLTELAETVEPPRTVLDVGAGTGAVAFAALSVFEPAEIRCLERERFMLSAGQTLTKEMGEEKRVSWQMGDVLHTEELPRADLVTAGYMLGEIAAEQRMQVTEKLFSAAETLVLIEPGTPRSSGILREIREKMKNRAFVLAPCPGEDCLMTGGDWCHFSVRVARSQLQKKLKGGDAPYEDEKYSYLVLAHRPGNICRARVLRHPEIEKGRITVTLCTKDGITRKGINKKDPLWKWARKAKWGDLLSTSPKGQYAGGPDEERGKE